MSKIVPVKRQINPVPSDTEIVSPEQGLATQTPSVAGQAIDAIAPNVSGGYITNPSNANDQGLPSAESLFINPVTSALLQANGTTIELKPGQTFIVIPNSTTAISVASNSPNHMFTSVQWF